MKNLFTSYLKDVLAYELQLSVCKDSVLVIKKIKKIKEPFYLEENGKRICILDHGYQIVEYMPFDDGYVCRIHLDNQKHVIEYFFSITLNNQFCNYIPTFFDTGLAVVYCRGICKLYNEEAIKKLLEESKISEEDYQSCYRVAYRIQKEIKENKNKIINNDLVNFHF